MSFDTVTQTLSSAVANAATFTVAYPANTNAGTYKMGYRHKVVSNAYGTFENGDDVSFSFGTAEITITNNSGATIAAGTVITTQLDQPGADKLTAPVANKEKMADARLIHVTLGAPDTADADGAVASQACTLASGLATGINGALAAGGVATFDVPRNVVAAWTGTAVLTVTGTDEYGEIVKESSASGTSLAGKKAFKTITGVTTSADITALTVGSGDVLGLPAYLPSLGRVTRELQDGAAATAGTVVAGVRTAATATTGDVRGTYDPNSACNGALCFDLFLVLDNPGDRGVAQFAG